MSSTSRIEALRVLADAGLRIDHLDDVTADVQEQLDNITESIRNLGEGSQGPQGPQGLQGPQGPQGPQGEAGTSMVFFQAQDDGATTQATTNSPQVLKNVWDTPSLTTSDFSWSGETGELTINTSGIVEFNIKVTTYQSGNNRHELHVQLLKNNTVLVEDSQYASRDNSKREGSAYLNGFKTNCEAGDVFKVRIYSVGVSALVGHSNVANQTYFSTTLYS